MDRETKMFLMLCAVMIIIVTPLVVFTITKLDKRTEMCSEKNGIMLKSRDGWQCIDAKVIK